MSPIDRRGTRRVQAARGFSLIELMVVIVISLITSLAVFGVLSSSEGKKRTTNSINNIDQAGAYATYILDKQIRSAGSGFAQTWQQMYGCSLYAKLSSTQLLPSGGTSPLPAEFSHLVPGTANNFRLAPVLIAKGQVASYTTPWDASPNAQDYLIVMAGTAGYGEMPTNFTTVPSGLSIPVNSTIAYNPNDVVLLGDVLTGTGVAQCMIDQVSSTFTPSGTGTSISLGGSYSASIGSSTVQYSKGGYVLDLGQTPQFIAYGVGNHHVLYSYDLLQTGGLTTSQAITDGVYEMHALYGVDTSGTGSAFTWVDPGTAPWDIASLMAGTEAAATNLKAIKAIRLGLIMRTSLPEKTPPQQTMPTLFKDLSSLSLSYTPVITGNDLNYRYKAFEVTIPVRNNLL